MPFTQRDANPRALIPQSPLQTRNSTSLSSHDPDLSGQLRESRSLTHLAMPRLAAHCYPHSAICGALVAFQTSAVAYFSQRKGFH